MEVRIHAEGQVGRIKVLAANPRTARGFSGDLILDEFAFHEDSAAIWEAAEPILASNPDFQCRIASTGNGRHNMFYRMVNGLVRYRGAARIPVAARGRPEADRVNDGVAIRHLQVFSGMLRLRTGAVRKRTEMNRLKSRHRTTKRMVSAL